MKIGIDARLWNETGVGRYIRNLVWQLEDIDKKNEYTLFVKRGIRNQELGIRAEKIKLVETDIPWHTIEEQVLFYKVLDNELLDLVHFPYFSVPILYNRPFVITIHDLIINHFPTGKASTLPLPVYILKQIAYKYVMKQAAQKSQKILTVSEATKREIIDHLRVASEKIIVTYEGVDKSLHTSQRSINNYGKYFLYVGNAYPHKNLERLIEVFDQLKGKHNDIQLLLVGNEDFFYKKLKVTVHQKQLGDTIKFMGKAGDTELSELYSNAVALITPSRMEGFGLPGLEAMQHGTLVLASDIPVYREIYQNAAVYFDPLDGRTMHATIRRVLDANEKFNKHKEKGLQLVKSFSWEKMAKETLEVYESCIGV